MAYIRRAAEPAGCLFCRVGRARADRRDLVLARTGPDGPCFALLLPASEAQDVPPP